MMITSIIHPRNIDWICYDLSLYNPDRHHFDDVDLSFINPFFDPPVILNTAPYARAELRVEVTARSRHYGHLSAQTRSRAQ